MKAAFKVVKVSGYWKYKIYKRTWFSWLKIGGRDTMGGCQELIEENLRNKQVFFFDEEGKEIIDSTDRKPE